MPTPEEDLKVLYDNTLDGGRYRLRVIMQDRTTAYLTVTREADGLILDEGPVYLTYEPVFGPDAGDVAEWQERTIKVVDDVQGNPGSSGPRGRGEVGADQASQAHSSDGDGSGGGD